MRIVSLVPSLTLTLFDFGLDATSILVELRGAFIQQTEWLMYPWSVAQRHQRCPKLKQPNRIWS